MGVLQMTASELHEHADRIAENAFLKLVSRVSMALAAPIVAVALSWFGNTLWQMNTIQGEMKGQIALLSQQVAQVSDGKYTANDAARDAKAQLIKDNEQDRRINVLETRLDQVTRSRQP